MAAEWIAVGISGFMALTVVTGAVIERLIVINRLKWRTERNEADIIDVRTSGTVAHDRLAAQCEENERISHQTREDVVEIKTNVKWIREKIERLNGQSPIT